MKIKQILFVFLVAVTTFTQANAQKVFFIGDDTSAYESTMKECPATLLSVSGNNMSQANFLWQDVLVAIQNKAAKEDFPLNGIKFWANIFFKKNGKIELLGFYPMPSSKNMDFEDLKPFLKSFAKEYKLPKEHSTCFSHYGRASFPIGY